MQYKHEVQRMKFTTANLVRSIQSRIERVFRVSLCEDHVGNPHTLKDQSYHLTKAEKIKIQPKAIATVRRTILLTTVVAEFDNMC